jgi:CDP-glucose 4,6-dehydratase
MFGNFFKDKKILVTGHTGFQGSWLTLWLKLLGAMVIGYSLPPPTKPSLFESLELENDITHIIADIRNLDELKRAISSNEPDLIFHLAAQSLVRESYEKPVETFSTNILGTVNVLDCIRNSTTVKGCIVYTSDKSYENVGTKQVYTENDRLGGNDPYSASKASSEIVTTAYRNSFFGKVSSPRIATIRAGNVIGGGDWSKDRLIPDFVRAVINKQKINVRNPEHTRPWQFVLEPLSGILWLAVKMIQESKYSEAWNFGPSSDSKQFTVKMMLKAISTEWGINESIMEENTNNELHEDKFLNIDSSKAEKFLGLKLVYNLQETITETVSWYKHFTEQKNEIKNFSIEQIKNYTDHAKQLNLSWT